jgi:hypothetical protein
MAVATTDPVRLPPAPRIPKLLQGVGFVAAREKSVAALAKRYAPGERLHSRGVATAPARGGRAVVYRRATKSAEPAGQTQRVSA